MFKLDSLRQTHATDQILVSGVGPETVEHWPDFRKNQVVLSPFVTLFQPGESLLFIPEVGINHGKQPGRNISSLRKLL